MCVDCRPEVVWWRVWDPSPFVPRLECGNWPDWLVAAWLVPSVGLLLLYWAIAAFLVVLWRRSRGRAYPYHHLPWIAAFFVGCGGGHVMNALAFVWPAYQLYVLWDFYTLATSLVGACGIWHIVRWARGQLDALRQETQKAQAETVQARRERDEEHDKRIAAIERRERAVSATARQLDELRDVLEAQVGRVLTDADYSDLRRRLHDLRGVAR